MKAKKKLACNDLILQQRESLYYFTLAATLFCASRGHVRVSY